jgi:methionyl-tRNA formyltransferase
LRVVFAGTPAFAVPALEALASAGHDIPLVLTQPDRPAGRGMRLAHSEVAAAAERLGIEVAKPATLREAQIQSRLRGLGLDTLVVAAYGLILPRPVLEIPARGCLNIHASLLPRWRGAAPIQRALLAGDAKTGVCIMQMAEGLDTGPVLLERAIPIGARETTASLAHQLSALGAEAIVEALRRLDSLVPQDQDPALATYAAKIDRSEAIIDWQDAAEVIDRKVRAFNPSPGAETTLHGVRFKIWEAEPVADASLASGEIAQSGTRELRIGCGRGALRVLKAQRPGGRSLAIADFLRGNPWASSRPVDASH